MAENEALRREMEEYIEEHDITRLFERLAASIMYDRPDDLNKYIGEWLLRLNNAPSPQQPTAFVSAVASRTSASAISVTKTSSFNFSKNGLGDQKESGSAVRTSGLQAAASVLVPELEATDGSASAPEPEEPDLTAPLAAPSAVPPTVPGKILEGGNELDPYVFTAENIAVFYGLLDPLNEGSISLEHFREVAALMDLEQSIDWDVIPDTEIPQENFCDLLLTALRRDLDTLRANCQKKPKDALLYIGEAESYA